MEQRQMGHSGLQVSSLGIGTRTWGRDTDPHECAELLGAFMDAGGNFVDIEGDPSYPEALGVIGALCDETKSRGDLVLCLRSGQFAGAEAPEPGPSRQQMLRSLDAALAQMGTDYVDVWLAAGPRTGVPLTETLSALETAYRSGRARYVGLAGFSWWDGGAATEIARSGGWALSAWGAEISLLNPLPLSPAAAALHEGGYGLIAGAPLARGILTGKYRHSTPPDSRATSPRFRAEIAGYLDPRFSGVLDAAGRAGEGLDRSTAQVSLAWARDLPGVSTAVIGPRTVRQLEHLLEVAQWKVPSAINNVLAEVSSHLL